VQKGRREMIPEIKKILYATDLSKNSSYAFFYAVDMARKNDAKIVILHSVEPGHNISYSGIDVENLVKETRKEEQKAELKKIKKLVEEFCKRMDAYVGSSCLPLVSKILVPLGHPVEEILEAVNKEGCDAIVLGTHGKGFLKQTFLGSVAVKVLERTRKPVFIIPLPSEKTNINWDSI
jgi:nucleotide-binding universal stress UspA family protein